MAVPALAVCSCSSQSHAHRADNILRSETYRTWLVQGSDNGMVVLSVAPAAKIAKIELVNAGSQFVEVLASEEEADGDWFTIMPKSVFRTEKEVLAETARDRQRSTTLSPATSSKSWKRLKVVCSITPGLVDVKDAKYYFGLANLRIEIPSQQQDAATSASTLSQCVSPFASTTSKSSPPARTPPASICSAVQTPPMKARRLNPSSPSVADVTAVKPAAVSPTDLVVRRAADAAHTSTSKAVAESEADRRRKSGLERDISRQGTAPTKKPEQTQRPGPSSASASSLQSYKSSSSSSLSSGTSRAKPDDCAPLPLSSVLKGVCISIGGLENPERANVRTTAQKLGASYSPTVDRHCTHLLCAISGTPKHKQALRDGKIVVSPDWVAECLRRKLRVDARPFAV